MSYTKFIYIDILGMSEMYIVNISNFQAVRDIATRRTQREVQLLVSKKLHQTA